MTVLEAKKHKIISVIDCLRGKDSDGKYSDSRAVRQIHSKTVRHSDSDTVSQ